MDGPRKTAAGPFLFFPLFFTSWRAREKKNPPVSINGFVVYLERPQGVVVAFVRAHVFNVLFFSPSSLPPQPPPPKIGPSPFPLPAFLSPRQLRLHPPRLLLLLLLLPRPRRNPPRQHAQHQEGAQPHEDEPLGPPGRSRIWAPQHAHAAVAAVVFGRGGSLVFLVAAACSSSLYPTTGLVRGRRVRRIPARPRQHTAVGPRARRLDELPRGGEVELRRVGARHMGLFVLCRRTAGRRRGGNREWDVEVQVSRRLQSCRKSI